MSSTSTKPSKAAALALVQALIAGTEKHTPASSFTLGGIAYTTASLVQLLQGLGNAIAKANAAQASAKDAVSALRLESAQVLPVLRAYRKLLLTQYGNSAETLADYGVTPPKARAPRTSEQKAAAAAKLRATREARGTTSRKQKAAIKGNVTGVVVTPVTTPAPASPSTQPASMASNGAAQGPATK